MVYSHRGFVVIHRSCLSWIKGLSALYKRSRTRLKGKTPFQILQVAIRGKERALEVHTLVIKHSGKKLHTSFPCTTYCLKLTTWPHPTTGRQKVHLMCLERERTGIFGLITLIITTSPNSNYLSPFLDYFWHYFYIQALFSLQLPFLELCFKW